MLQISTERLTPLALVYFSDETGDPEPPGGIGDPEPPGIKPPTVNQSSTGADIKPPTATGTSDAEPPDSDEADPPIIISGGHI
jgi:hypothetical protein